MSFLLKALPTVFNVVKNVGKPLLDSINNIVQSLDGDGAQRERLARRYGLTTMLFPPRGQASLPAGLIDGLDHEVRPLASDEERDAVNVVYAIEKVRELNVLQEEIPFLGFDEYEFVVAQSFELIVPSRLSVVQTNMCSPVMNLGAKFLSLAQKFRVFKVVGVEFDVSFQNQNYSTQTIAYDPLITEANIEEMQRDLLDYMQGTAASATGHRVVYFHSDTQGQAPPLPTGKPIYEFRAYTGVLSKIKALPTAKDYGQLVAGSLAVEQPSYVLAGMRREVAASPVVHPGMSFVQTSYAADFQKTFAQNGQDINMKQMPVFGKFHYAVSNTFEQAIQMITTIKYRVVLKRSIDDSTYQTIVNGEVMPLQAALDAERELCL